MNAKEKKLSIKHVLNKRLKHAPGNKYLFPLYVRVIFDSKNAEFRSLLTYFQHSKVSNEFQWSVKGALRKESTRYVVQKEIDLDSVFFKKERDLVEKTIRYFLSININLIEKGEAARIVHTSLMFLREAASMYYRDLFNRTLLNDYSKLVQTTLSDSDLHFDVVIETLFDISNDKFKEVLRPFMLSAQVVKTLRYLDLHVIDFLENPEKTVEVVVDKMPEKNENLKNILLKDFEFAVKERYNKGDYET